MKRALKSIILISALFFCFLSLAENKLEPLSFDIKSLPPKPNEKNYSADSLSYKDDSIEIQGWWERAYDTDYLVFKIKLSDISQLRSVPASGNAFNINSELVGTTIAKRANAVLAMNGDYFTYTKYGYIIRQGHIIRRQPDDRDVLLIDKNGDFHCILKPKYMNRVNKELEKIGKTDKEIYNSYNFGPALIKNNELLIKENDRFSYNDISADKKVARISLSQVGKLEYVIIASSDEYSKDSKGLTIKEFAKLNYEVINRLYPEKGSLLSYNFDGGTSTTVVSNGKKVCCPGMKDRRINDMICFLSLVR